jgi:phospholipid N-methyltransferase
VQVHAAAADEVLADACGLPDRTVLVSSLPFRSLPPQLRVRSSLAIEQFLTARPGRRLLQYSYLPREPFELRHAERLRWRRLGAVWGNAPPAWVWELGAAAP